MKETTGSTGHPSDDGNRILDGAALKALAHPLRVQLLEVLSSYGPQTASSIGKRVGESSGATSYHLRQLARHGLVREVERGSARERWWERPRGSLTLSTPELEQDPTTREATRQVNRQFERGRSEALATFMASGSESIPPEWADAAVIATMNAHLTVDQLAALARDMSEIFREKLDAYRSEPGTPGTRPVQIHFNAFPLIDPQETT
ncbi:ArsR/SmtB family transcription factor [Arthrobacter antioxidans]|uniref:ArsR/SmtB family transcription factor n=1 Tax=Arthrobacter antioxidans TaxID=2895818 RepID=UPI001FFF27EA|nr:helix-turn-helix domain-containing protein [Arthrobacter antioxidans]